MPRMVRTGRGELVDFDAILIKQQISEAPMNIEVQRRKNFIDSKEGRSRSVGEDQVRSTQEQAPVDYIIPEATQDPIPSKKAKQPVEPIPVIPERT